MTSCLSTEELRDLIRPIATRLPGAQSELCMREVVTETLACAQSFVPCEAGSLMLRHPDEEGALIFVASFGMGASKLPGTVLPAGTGIAGQVYKTGVPLLTNSPTADNNFYKEIDRLTAHKTESLLVVPLSAFGESVGVLSLLNRIGDGFKQQDLDLLKVFSQYLTQSMQLMMEAKRQEDVALKDHLTGLYNDRYLYSYLARMIKDCLEYQHDLGLIFLDLDHFKAVVDTHGHLIGSQALAEIGRMIGQVASKYGAVCARYGGDEYVAVVPHSNTATMNELAESLRRTIESAELVCKTEAGQKIVLERMVTASVGVVCLSQTSTEGMSSESARQQLIRVADEAMYKAKALGKNRVHWYIDPGL